MSLMFIFYCPALFSKMSSPNLISVAAHPQVRRKLEDVSHKLDILYDKLRKQVLSPATLQGLHTILQHIWQYDYPACMQVGPNPLPLSFRGFKIPF